MNYQDMLAKQGAGSAHPGGFAATVEFLSHFPIRRGSRVLEVGCGTGRTACYLAGKGCDVTAVDIRPAMLEKARKRAEFERVQVHWVEGDACALPFAANQFDVVLLESVTVFVDPERALSEYHRVLRIGGCLHDREMMAVKRFPKKVAEAIRKLYGVKWVPNLEEWLALLRQADFREVGVWKPTAVPADLAMASDWAYPDPFLQMDEDLQRDPRFRYMLERNARIMTRYAEYLGYGVFLGTKR
ncbi:class I SAM-dependent methyltransferase [Effusibacillus pohliae]|uniref:class I SAM-dependent methyltransferase n=1 Tax=Effusibacillus pohliae TaxID=232270 RepID=UPI000363566C|nr:class I SAM-dependent methyltransferase [Effusibacillus pohliae]